MSSDCPICLEEFDHDVYKPIVGSCGHSLCEQCFQRPEFDEKCPTCRLNGAFAAGIPNFQMRELLEKNDAAQQSLAAVMTEKAALAAENDQMRRSREDKDQQLLSLQQQLDEKNKALQKSQQAVQTLENTSQNQAIQQAFSIFGNVTLSGNAKCNFFVDCGEVSICLKRGVLAISGSTSTQNYNGQPAPKRIRAAGELALEEAARAQDEAARMQDEAARVQDEAARVQTQAGQAQMDGHWDQADALYAKADKIYAKADGIYAKADGIYSKADGLYAKAESRRHHSQ